MNSLILNEVRQRVKDKDLTVVQDFVYNIASRYSGIDGDIAREIVKLFEEKPDESRNP